MRSYNAGIVNRNTHGRKSDITKIRFLLNGHDIKLRRYSIVHRTLLCEDKRFILNVSVNLKNIPYRSLCSLLAFFLFPREKINLSLRFWRIERLRDYIVKIIKINCSLSRKHVMLSNSFLISCMDKL